MHRKQLLMLGILTMITILASVIVILTEFGSMMISAQAQVNASTVTPEQKDAICNPNNPASKLNPINTTESRICGIPVTLKPSTSNATSSSINTTTGAEAPTPTPAPIPPPAQQEPSSSSSTPATIRYPHTFITFAYRIYFDLKLTAQVYNPLLTDVDYLDIGDAVDQLQQIKSTFNAKKIFPEFVSAADILSNAQKAKASGAMTIGYDLEQGAGYTPPKELADIPGSVAQASKAASAAELEFWCAPSMAIAKQ